MNKEKRIKKNEIPAPKKEMDQHDSSFNFAGMIEKLERNRMIRWFFYTGILFLAAVWIPSWLIRNNTFASAGFLGYPARLHTEQAVVFLTLPLLLLIREKSDRFRAIFIALAVSVFLSSFLPYKPVFYAIAILFYVIFFFFPSGRVLEEKPAGPLLWLGVASAIGGFAFFFTALVSQKAGMYSLGRNWLYYGTLILIPMGTYFQSIQLKRTGPELFAKLDTLAIWLFGASLGIEALYRIGASKEVPGGAMDFVRLAIVAWWVYSAIRHAKSTPAIASGSFLFLGLLGHATLPAMGSHFAHLAFLGGILPYSLLAISRLSGVTPAGGVAVPYLLMAAGIVRILAGLQERVVFLPVFLSALVALIAIGWLMFHELKQKEITK